jgi:carbamoyl-phosphate synthase large subunit
MPTWSNTKVFVSGGAGVIGTALVNRLIADGAQLLVGDLKPCPDLWINKLDYRKGDLNNIGVKELLDFQPEYFFHLAATFERSIETFEFWEENFHHNIKLSHHLMSCLMNCPSLKKVIFASSYLVYDPSLYLFQAVPQSVKNLKESSSIKPRNLCGMAKLLHEQELNFMYHFRAKTLETVSARIFRSYGKNSRDIISRWIRALLNEEPISIYCLEGKFDFVYAEDVADGLLYLAKKGLTGVVNLGTGNARTIADVVKVLQTHFPKMNFKMETSDILFEASQADMAQFVDMIHWKPSHQLEDAIPQIIEYEKLLLGAPIRPLNSGGKPPHSKEF